MKGRWWGNGCGGRSFLPADTTIPVLRNFPTFVQKYITDLPQFTMELSPDKLIVS